MANPPIHLQKGLQMIRDPQTGKTYKQMPEPYEGQRHLWLYWIDDGETWRVPVCFEYSTLLRICAGRPPRPCEARARAERTAPTAQGGVL